LEVHRQLMTEHKMFCRCPAGIYTTDHDGEILRLMRPTFFELGVYDGTALMEFKTRKNILYLLNKKNVCTYEMDDTPPFLINQQSLDVAIEQCLMLGCDIVLDGSIPTGFQRTAIVGIYGELPFRGRTLSITQVSVEEDSCREVSDTGHLVVWRTDRLGMPLIETVTGADLRTPDEVAEAILLIGRVCRSTEHVRVGMGASRQDVNVSVRGGRRVEIKGVPQAGWAPALVHGEAVRQVNLLRLRDDLKARGMKEAGDLAIEHADVTTLLESSGHPFLRRESWERLIEEQGWRKGLELGQGPFAVRAIKLVGLADTLLWPTQPDRTFADELAGRIRVIAGLDQPPILLHTRKWPDYPGSEDDRASIEKQLACGPNDAVVVVCGAERDTLTAAQEVRLRYADALDGIPNETRQPFEDGTTDFERILPGPDRMYPDTDSPPIEVTRERVVRLRDALPPPPWVREKRYGKANVPRNTIYFLIRRGGASLVDMVVESCSADLRRACFFFGERLKGLRRSGATVDAISRDRWCELFDLLGARTVLWEAWKLIVETMAESPDKDIARIVEEAGLDRDPAGWDSRVRNAAASCRPDHEDGTLDQRVRFAMGRVMPELRGRVPATEVMSVLRETIEGSDGVTAR
ncbi:MAG: Glu-tRNA(Gln) amidotransferase subunit GatE, partial [Deltaproteobacteria bacterium]|nr:Glu-tRNA(Gln) amidotransferase subunit GatE [Deltaproteobacteria bacterium]